MTPSARAIVHAALFPEPDALVYAIMDGASNPNLQQVLVSTHAEHQCLYSGDLAPDLAQTAPYLARLAPHHPLTDWILQDGWGQHLGIFVRCDMPLHALRRHLRTLLMVRSHDNQLMYFRFYDPRVMADYLPTCQPDELTAVFGPITCIIAEAKSGAALLEFRRKGSGLKIARKAVYQ